MPSWKGTSRGGAFGYRFFIFIIKTFGVRFAYFFLVFVALHFIPFAPLATHSNWYYFRKVKQYGVMKSVWMLYVNYYRFGQIIIDKVAARSGLEEKYRYEFENYESFLDVLNGDTGVIMIGAHIGNWEIGGSFFGDYAKKMNIVMYDAEYRNIKKVLEQNLEGFNYNVIPIKEDDFEHVYRIKDALDRKEYVCFQGDRFVSEKTAKAVDFLGKPAAFPVGPFQISARYKVPVVFFFSMREKRMTYRFKFFIADIASEASSRKTADVLMQQYIGVLETVLCHYPEQWFNYYKFWDE